MPCCTFPQRIQTGAEKFGKCAGFCRIAVCESILCTPMKSAAQRAGGAPELNRNGCVEHRHLPDAHRFGDASEGRGGLRAGGFGFPAVLNAQVFLQIGFTMSSARRRRGSGLRTACRAQLRQGLYGLRRPVGLRQTGRRGRPTDKAVFLTVHTSRSSADLCDPHCFGK